MLASLCGRTLLFSETRQAIFELDDGAAGLWDQLESGAGHDDIVGRLPECSSEERRAVADALEQLASLRDPGAPVVRERSRQTSRASPQGLVLELAGVAVELDLPPTLSEQVEAELGHLKSAAIDVQARIAVRKIGDRFEIVSGGRRRSCTLPEVGPLLKGELLDEVLRSATYEVALHGAGLIADGRMLLLCGSPGAGKTTLAIALTKAGFGLAADDVVLLGSDGLATGVPLPFAAKSPSWPLVETFYPDPDHRSHRRPDDQIVRYFLPDGFALPEPSRAIGLVLFLDRQADVAAALEAVDPTDALAALIAEGAARDERLSAAGFMALVEALNNSRCFTLTYGDLAEAVEAVRGLYS